MFFLETMSTAELTLPVGNVPTSSSMGIGMNTLTGLGGFVTLGLAAKAKPLITTVGEEVLIPKDSKNQYRGHRRMRFDHFIPVASGLLLGADGKAKQSGIVWHGPPEDLGASLLCMYLKAIFMRQFSLYQTLCSLNTACWNRASDIYP